MSILGDFIPKKGRMWVRQINSDRMQYTMIGQCAAMSIGHIQPHVLPNLAIIWISCCVFRNCSCCCRCCYFCWPDKKNLLIRFKCRQDTSKTEHTHSYNVLWTQSVTCALTCDMTHSIPKFILHTHGSSPFTRAGIHGQCRMVSMRCDWLSFPSIAATSAS